MLQQIAVLVRAAAASASARSRAGCSRTCSVVRVVGLRPGRNSPCSHPAQDDAKRFFEQILQHICRTSGTAERYWLAHTMRAIQSTSSASSARSACAGSSDCSSSVLAVRRFSSFDHHLSVAGLHHHAVAAADRGARRHHDDVAVAVGGLHRIAVDLQRIGVLVACGGQRHLVPALAGKENRCRRNGRHCRPARGRATAPIAGCARRRRSVARRCRSRSRWRPAPLRTIWSTASVRGRRP